MQKGMAGQVDSSIVIVGCACIVLAMVLTARGCGEVQRFVPPYRACDAGEEHDCIGLVVELDKDLYAQGDRITVTATTMAYDIYEDILGPGAANVSEVRFSRDHVGRSFDFALVDELGQPVSLTEEGAGLGESWWEIL